MWVSTLKEKYAAAAAKSLQSCLTLGDPRDGSPPGPPRPWDSPGENTGVCCHFLLQCMKVKSEREVAQLCPTLSDPMDCSPQGSSIHGIFQARVLEWGAIAFSAWRSIHSGKERHINGLWRRPWMTVLEERQMSSSWQCSGRLHRSRKWEREENSLLLSA